MKTWTRVGWATNRNSLFCIGLSLYLSTYFISEIFYRDSTSGCSVPLRLVSLYLMILNELGSSPKYAHRDYIWIIVMFIGCVSAYISTRTILLFGLLIVFLGRNIPFEAILRCYVLTLTLWLGFSFLGSQAGLIDENIVIAGGRLRSSLGFTWPSRFQNYYFTLTCSVLCLKKEKTSWGEIIVLFVLAGLFNSYTDARSPFVLTLALLLLASLIKVNASLPFPGLRKFLALNSFPIAFCVVVFAGLIYSPGSLFMAALNSLFSGRLAYSHTAICEYPITLFGSSVFGNQNDGWFEAYLDSGFLNLLFTYGLLVLLIYLFVFTRILKIRHAEGDRFTVLCLVLLAAHSIPEAQILMLSYTPFLFLMPEAFENAMEVRVNRRGAKPKRFLNALSV